MAVPLEVPRHRRLNCENCSDFEANLGYTVSSCPALTVEWDLLFNSNKPKHEYRTRAVKSVCSRITRKVNTCL